MTGPVTANHASEILDLAPTLEKFVDGNAKRLADPIKPDGRNGPFAGLILP
jgi:hypothetical protein